MPHLEEFPHPDIHLIELLPGMFAGAIQVSLGHPFDTVKTRTQAVADRAGVGPRITSAQTAKDLFKEQGVRGFYRGALPPMVINGTKRGIQLMLWERITPLVGNNTFVSGAFAGVTATLVSCPLHVVKIHAQTSPHLSTSTAAVRDLVVNGGPMSLYRGLPMHAVRDAGFAGMYLGTYGYFRRNLPEDMPLRVPLAASTASICTWGALQPLDTLKTMSQLGLSRADILARIRYGASSAGGGASATQATGVAPMMWRSWRGVVAALIRAGPVNAAGMVVYEASKTRVVAWELAHGIEPLVGR